MIDRPDDDFDATEFEGYPKFPTLVGYFGGHTPTEPADPDEDAFRHGHGRIMAVPDHQIGNNLAAIATELHIANLIAWQRLTGESNRVAIRKALGLNTDAGATS